jgi:hypothetical protein
VPNPATDLTRSLEDDQSGHNVDRQTLCQLARGVERARGNQSLNEPDRLEVDSGRHIGERLRSSSL